MKKMRQCAAVLLLLSALTSHFSNVFAQGTAFTYQGRLNANGATANGLYDFRFRLDADPAGNTILNTMSTNAIGVTNGLFITTIDFGAGWFNGSNYWLEVDVRTNNTTSYTQLNPFQLLTPTPYAEFASTASNVIGSVSATQLSGAIANGNLPASPNFSGTVTAGFFLGNGANLTSLNAGNISSGTVPLAQLPASVITNGASGVSLAGSFSGNGGGVTNIQLAAVGPAGTFSLQPFYYGGAVSAYGVGTSPNSVVAADVNGNGKLALISANDNAGTLTVLTNNGSGVFGSNATLNVGNSPGCVAAVGNVDGQGHMALISANSGANTLTVFTNNGFGVFGSNATLNTGGRSVCVVAVTNVDGQGHMALVSANEGGNANTLTVLTNNGSGVFGFNATLTVGAVGSYPDCVVAADVNGDGHPDLISANSLNNTLTVFTNNGFGVFGSNATLTVGNRPTSVVAADVNGDGHPDLISANGNANTLTVLTNNGSGVFGFNATLSVGNTPGCVVAADVNGDGHPDLICANVNIGGNGTLTVLTNNGNGGFSFNATLNVGNTPECVTAADLDGDGKTDLISANWNDNALSVIIPEAQVLSAPNPVVFLNSANSFAGTFAGNGSGLTGLAATNLTGTVPLGQLPAAVVTNTETGVTLSGTFNGNGSGLTNLNATQLSGAIPGGVSVPATNLTGTVPAAQLPPVVVTNNASSVTIGGTNMVAPLTVPPTVPASAIGMATGLSGPRSIAVAGRYAYVVNANNYTLQIFDVSNPAGPTNVVTGGSVGTDADPFSIAVAGRYAYVANFGGNSFQIFDISNPSNPFNVARVTGLNSPESVAVAGHYAYLANYGGSLLIFDVSKPSSPILVGTATTGSGADSVAVVGRYAYVVESNAGILQVFDVSNPASPVPAGSAATGLNPYSVAVSGRYAYVVNYGSYTLQIFDVSNPDYPTNVVAGGSVGSGSTNPYFVTVAGRYAYVLNGGGNTLQVFDVSNPAVPARAGSVTGLNGPVSVAVSGRYAYLVNDGGGTLQIFDLGGAYIQQLEAGAMETGTLQTRDTATVGNNLDVRGGLTVSASARISGGLSVDNGTIIATNFTGNGSGLTGLNAAQLSGSVPTGVSVPSADLNGALPAISGASLTGLDASQLSSGVVPQSLLPGFQSSSNYIAVGGGQNNTIAPSADHAAIGGGFNNTIGANDYQGAIAGGYYNTILASSGYAAIGGGQYNTNSSNEGVVAGGQINLASGQYQSSVGGGYKNTASGNYSTVPGGFQNVAAGNSSFAAGDNATDNGFANAFVWGDGTRQSVAQGTNTFNVLATGGFWIFSGAFPAGVKLTTGSSAWATISDRNAKKNFAPVDTKAVLEKLAAVPMQQWNYKWEKDGDVPNIGPMAQDFKAAFYPGRDDKSITTLEFDGVELAAIQGLNQKIEEKDAEIEKLKEKADEVDSLKMRLADLEQVVQSLAARK